MELPKSTEKSLSVHLEFYNNEKRERETDKYGKVQKPYEPTYI